MVKRTDISEIKKLIVERIKPFAPEKIILFGSYAYGEPTEDSDLHICVVEKDFTSKIAEAIKFRAVLKNIRMSKDILVEKESFLHTHSGDELINSVWYDIVRKGEVLYEKG